MDNLKGKEDIYIYIVQGRGHPAIMMVGFDLAFDSWHVVLSLVAVCVQPKDLLDLLSIFGKDQLLKGQSM